MSKEELKKLYKRIERRAGLTKYILMDRFCMMLVRGR